MEKKSSGAALWIAAPLLVSLVFGILDRFLFGHPAFRALAMAGAVLFCAGLLSALLKAMKPESHRGRTVLSLLASLVRYAAALVVICWGLSIFGADVHTIVTGVGILALVVGFGAESLIADVVTGFFMLFENQYNVGDIVEVNGFRGTVKEIGIRTTAIEDVGKNIKIVNNSDMKNILNRSDNASMATAVIDIPYATDLEALEAKLPKLMEDIYGRHRDVMLSAPRYLGVQALGASGITLRFAAEIHEADIFNAPRILNRELLLGFRALGVECPFPQLDVHNG